MAWVLAQGGSAQAVFCSPMCTLVPVLLCAAPWIHQLCAIARHEAPRQPFPAGVCSSASPRMSDSAGGTWPEGPYCSRGGGISLERHNRGSNPSWWQPSKHRKPQLSCIAKN